MKETAENGGREDAYITFPSAVLWSRHVPLRTVIIFDEKTKNHSLATDCGQRVQRIKNEKNSQPAKPAGVQPQKLHKKPAAARRAAAKKSFMGVSDSHVRMLEGWARR